MAMTNINIRIDADKKLKAQELFSSCLLYTSDAADD